MTPAVKPVHRAERICQLPIFRDGAWTWPCGERFVVTYQHDKYARARAEFLADKALDEHRDEEHAT